MNKKQKLLLRFLEESGDRLHRMLTRLTLDETTAEELMQELFVRLFEMRNLEKIENLHAYATRIAINLAFDQHRKQQHFRPIPIDLEDSRIPNINLRISRNEDIQQILDVARQLSGLTRECFVLRYIEQMDYGRIAERIGKTPQQVRGLCSKGIQRIRQIINDQNAPYYKEAINE